MNHTFAHNSWRTPHPHKPNFIDRTPNIFPATRFFDQLSFIGDEGVACFLLETDDGLVLLDCMNPDQRSIDIIETGIHDLGHEPNELTAILITHGHGDHWGMAGYFRERYGCKLYMGEEDYKNACITNPGFPWEPLDYPMDEYLSDSGQYTFGNTTVTSILTPGHTKGCMSFIIPVTDEERPHVMAMWGGSGIMPDTNIDHYLSSLRKFSKICDEMGADGEISSHPFIDCGIERLQVVRNIVDGVPNPFVIGIEGRHYYENMFHQMALDAKANCI
ncbi:MAG: MBL fold metallo-hydrolase [Clostridiales bacterium]|nr:MBL fold metallo-hydrolase [Clostridiales bacterium]